MTSEPRFGLRGLPADPANQLLRLVHLVDPVRHRILADRRRGLVAFDPLETLGRVRDRPVLARGLPRGRRLRPQSISRPGAPDHPRQPAASPPAVDAVPHRLQPLQQKQLEKVAVRGLPLLVLDPSLAELAQ
jgi:hypothetical protein